MLAANDRNWRATGDLGRWWTLARTGCHLIDLSCWIAEMSSGDHRLASLTGWVSKDKWPLAREQTARVNLDFVSGMSAQILSSVILEPAEELRVHGTQGSAVCTRTFSTTGQGTIEVDSERVKFPIVNPYVAELADFIDAIRTDRPPTVGGDIGAYNVRLLDALERNQVTVCCEQVSAETE